jgi:hypothetical protein
MKKAPASVEVTRFNRAAFRVDAGAVSGGRLELLLEETLAQVFGGTDLPLGSFDSVCTEFVCNLYAPPPPPPQPLP